MPRLILDTSLIHSEIQEIIAKNHTNIVQEVQTALNENPVVIVGMGQNPFPRKARKYLDSQGISYKYLEYGNYFKGWRLRTALKMWSGWPTFPMIFIHGILIGGASDLEKMLRTGDFLRMLNAKAASSA